MRDVEIAVKRKKRRMKRTEVKRKMERKKHYGGKIIACKKY